MRLAKFGPVIQVGETTDEEKPKFVGLPKELRLETVTLDEALPLLTLPRIVGSYNGEEIITNNGRFGAYVQVKRSFVSLPDEITPFNVTEAQAIDLIVAKAAADAAAQLATFEGPEGVIEVRKGRYGPYIKYNKANFKIPKDIDPESLTAESTIKIINEAPPKKSKKPLNKTKKSVTKTKKKI